MRHRMVVVAVKPFAYRDVPVVTDDVCVVEPVEAAALVYQGQARWPIDGEGFGVYRRRDVIAEGARPRRSRRRDMAVA